MIPCTGGERARRNLHKTLVLGGSGFIGTALIRELLSRRKQVSVLEHDTPVAGDLGDQVSLFRGSITNFNWKQLEFDPPDVIYHLARIAGKWKIGRVLAARKSVSANERLSRWLSSFSNPPLLVFVSGTLAYGTHHEEFVTESTLLSPASYSKEYSQGEKPVIKILDARTLPVMVLRPSWVYGPGSWFQRFYLKPIIKYRQVPLYGEGNNWMSFIHVEDCAGMIAYLSECAPVHRTYNLFHGYPLHQRDFAQLLLDLVPDSRMKRIKLNDLKRKQGRATAEAFSFSLKVSTEHESLYKDYQFKYPDLREGLRSVLPAD